jgi:YHS domain-containing protein
MTVAPESAAATHDYDHVTYYFCATNCAERFSADPAHFLD